MGKRLGRRMSHGPRLLIAALMVLTAGCAGGTASTPPPSVDISGKWSGTWLFENPSMGGGQIISMDLKQTGSDVSGPATVSGPTVNRPTRFEGTVRANTVTLRSAFMSWSSTVNGDQMTGIVNRIMPANVTVRRQP